MMLCDPKAIATVSDPLQMPTSELLEGNYTFRIPSYQRGYRWESSEGPGDHEVRQVDDLLNDLTHFIDTNANVQQTAYYYLQPLMVKPFVDANGNLVWDVLDGQQRLTTMLLLLRCINEKLHVGKQLYSIRYMNCGRDIDFGRITFDRNSQDHDYPKPNANLDSFFVRKAKDKIEKWFDSEMNLQQRKDNLKKALFYEDSSRIPSSTPSLRVAFIWYNVQPLQSTSSQTPVNVSDDIAVFNRLNGGQISLTNSELLKALFYLCVKKDPSSRNPSYRLNEETLTRKWDEMGRKFQDDEFWTMICPKNRTYENRLDFLFDFICESDPRKSTSNSYRYYYNDMKEMLSKPDTKTLEKKWDDIKRHFDILCKWHENTTLHNYIGYLIEFGKSAATILQEIKKKSPDPSIATVEGMIKSLLNIEKEDVDSLMYHGNETAIRKLLLLFNVETSEKHGERFSYRQYKGQKYDIEHINSQTDNAITGLGERVEWVRDQALATLRDESFPQNHPDFNSVQKLIKRGENLLNLGESMNQGVFDKYRQDVESYYAFGVNSKSKYDKDWIGNLTLLNSSINREYKNALFPKKLSTIKKKDQEGKYIPPCTRFLFMKYYSKKGSPSAFNMMRWRDDDQEGYYDAIVTTLKDFLK